MTKTEKTSIEDIHKWLTFFAKNSHLLAPDQEESMIVDMISGKQPPENYKVKAISTITLKQARKDVSRAIKRHREKIGMSATEFAKSMKRSLPYVSLVENGKRSPNIVDLQK